MSYFTLVATVTQNVTAQKTERFAFGAVDSGLILSRVKPMTIKLVFTVSLLDAQHERDSVKNKPASLFVVPLGKAFSEICPSRCGREMAGNS